MVVSGKGKVPQILFAEFIYLKRIISFANCLQRTHFVFKFEKLSQHGNALNLHSVSSGFQTGYVYGKMAFSFLHLWPHFPDELLVSVFIFKSFFQTPTWCSFCKWWSRFEAFAHWRVKIRVNILCGKTFFGLCIFNVGYQKATMWMRSHYHKWFLGFSVRSTARWLWWKHSDRLYKCRRAVVP